MNRIIVLFLVALTFNISAMARTKVCSSADQKIKYTLFRSDGGAHMIRESVSFNNVTQNSLNYNINIDAQFSDVVAVKSTETDANFMHITVETVSGSVTDKKNKKHPFSDSVICKEYQSKNACVGPNGQPCP